MTIHHLNCCTMCPLAQGRVNPQGHLVGHVLAIVTDAGDLTLVDTGLGTPAMTQPAKYFGGLVSKVFRPVLDEQECAVRRIEALGYTADDVRDIFVTHLDADHAGGLPDFPRATVHLHHAELAEATIRRHPNSRLRYFPGLWAHNPRWAPYGAGEGGDDWFGFQAVREIAGFEERILAIPLPGHTVGHTALAVRDGERWLLHTGDAYYHAGSMDPAGERASRWFRIVEPLLARSPHKIAANHERLRELARRDEVTVFSGHDPTELAALQGA